MSVLKQLASLTFKVDWLPHQICAACLLFMMCIGAADVILGNLIGVRPAGTVDISQALFVAAVFLALPHVVRRRAHIRVDIALHFLPARVTRVLGCVADGISILVYLALAWAMWDLFASSWQMNEQSLSTITFPIYPLKFAAFLALVLTALISLVQLVLRSSWETPSSPEEPPSADPETTGEV
jgi:TRAP-type C4-dicarboxylate transport system permease small subunit